MQVSAHRAVVIISGLMTLLVLGGGALAVGIHQGWVRIAPDDEITTGAQTTVAMNERVAPASAEAPAVRAVQPATQDEAAIYRQKLDEAYRALDEAYAQIRALQSPQSRFAAARHDDDRLTEHDDEDGHRGRRSDRRRSRDD